MFSVIEFGQIDGGGIAVVRSKWLTPRKTHCVWPAKQINKHLVIEKKPDDKWVSYTIGRIFYVTDDLQKAREKSKQAEIESEIGTDSNEPPAIHRQRRPRKKIYESEDSDEGIDANREKQILYPKPPSTVFALSQSTSTLLDPSELPNQTSGSSASNRTSNLPPSTTNINNDLTTSSSCSLDITPFLTNKTESKALDVIARHLARIEQSLKELEIKQDEILARVRSSSTTIAIPASMPTDINIPCNNLETLTKLEEWLSFEGNDKLLENYLSIVGGHKTAVIVRRILEKLFTNDLAVTCNWTGKNKKTPLKDLLVIKSIKVAVRRHKIAESSTDAEINTTVANWFRFTKDRNGGREKRRLAATATEPGQSREGDVNEN